MDEGQSASRYRKIFFLMRLRGRLIITSLIQFHLDGTNNARKSGCLQKVKQFLIR